MKKVNLTVIFACLLIAIIAAVVVVGLMTPSTNEVIQGEVELSSYRVSGKVPGRVAEIRVSEGDQVRKGDTLVVLEAPDVMAKLNQAMAALGAAQALERKAAGGARDEQIQGAYEMWQKAQAGLEVAQKSYDRVAALFADGVLPEQKRDEVLANLKAMQATEKAAKSQYDMAVAGAQREDIAAAHAQVERANNAVAEVNSYVGEMTLTALADGEVGEIYPEVGELVGTGSPLVSVVRTDDVWFTFNVREDLLPGISVGSVMTVYVPAADKDVEIRVSRIKNVGSYATWKATKALDAYDLKTFEVKAEPVNASDVNSLGLRGGMSAILRR